MWATRSLPEEKVRWALSESFVRARERAASVRPVVLFLTGDPEARVFPARETRQQRPSLSPNLA